MILGLFLMVCFVAVVIISIGTSIIRGILHFILGLFGFSRYTNNTTGRSGSSRQSTQQSRPHQTPPSGGKKREKVFDKTDGEYVDFEEL